MDILALITFVKPGFYAEFVTAVRLHYANNK